MTFLIKKGTSQLLYSNLVFPEPSITHAHPIFTIPLFRKMLPLSSFILLSILSLNLKYIAHTLKILHLCCYIAAFVLFNSTTVTAVIQVFSIKASSERLKIISYLQKNAIVWHFCTGSKCSFHVNFKFSFKRSKGYGSVIDFHGKSLSGWV